MRIRCVVAVAVSVLAACGSASPTTDSNHGSVVTSTSAVTSTSHGSTTSAASTTVEPTTTTAATTTSTTATTTVPPTTTATTTVPPTTTRPTVPPTTTRPTVPPTTLPPGGGPSQLLWRLPTSQQTVAITIDAGSDLGFTYAILDTLAAEGVQASFGVTGSWADKYPDAVRRMAADGHQVMNHSYSHRSFTGASAPDPLLATASRQADLAKAEATLSALIGGTTKPFWRPPYGDSNAGVLADVGAAGYGWTVMWTVDSRGWKGLSADEIIDRVLGLTEPGAILAFHVGSASQDAAALGPIIDGLRDAGYSFVTVADAVGH